MTTTGAAELPDPTLEPIYAAVADDLAWSPAQLRTPFDVGMFVAASYSLLGRQAAPLLDAMPTGPGHDR